VGERGGVELFDMMLFEVDLRGLPPIDNFRWNADESSAHRHTAAIHNYYNNNNNALV